MNNSPLKEGKINIVTAADGNYAIPLTVMLYSVAEALRPGYSLQVFILDGGITEKQKNKIMESLDPYSVTLQWLRPDKTSLDKVPITGHISEAAYYRLQMSSLLPSDMDRVIYLDSDLILVHDITDLWNSQLDDNVVAAVPDAALFYFNAREVVPNLPDDIMYPASPGLECYKELNLPPESLVFNSGVLMIDLAKWRELEIGRQALNHAVEFYDSTRLWDQDALNVILHNKWKRLDMRWNSSPVIYRYQDNAYMPFTKDDFENMKNDPWIIHFTDACKPWQSLLKPLPFAEKWFEVLDRTAWNGWRPPVPFEKRLYGRAYLKFRGYLIRLGLLK